MVCVSEMLLDVGRLGEEEGGGEVEFVFVACAYEVEG